MIKIDPERILSLKEYRCSGGVPNPGHCPNLGHLQKCLDLVQILIKIRVNLISQYI